MTVALVPKDADISIAPDLTAGRVRRSLASRAAAAVLAICGLSFSLPAAAGGDVVAGTLFGAGAGALVGQAFGGRQGAVVGGVIGAVAGNALASHDRHHRYHGHNHGVTVYPQAAVYPVHPPHVGWSAPVYPVGPAPAYVHVGPSYLPPPAVYVAPRPIYYPPPAVVYQPVRPRHWDHHHHHRARHHGSHH